MNDPKTTSIGVLKYILCIIAVIWPEHIETIVAIGLAFSGTTSVLSSDSKKAPTTNATK